MAETVTEQSENGTYFPGELLEFDPIKWEYYVGPIVRGGVAASAPRLGRWLDTQGEDGWELVQILSLHPLFWVIFKRKKE